MEKIVFFQYNTAIKVSIYGVFSGPHFPVFRPEKIRIWTLFMQCKPAKVYDYVANGLMSYIKARNFSYLRNLPSSFLVALF